GWRFAPGPGRLPAQNRAVQHAGRRLGDEHAARRGGAAAGRMRHRAGVSAEPPIRWQQDGRRGAGILLCTIRKARGSVVCTARVTTEEAGSFARTRNGSRVYGAEFTRQTMLDSWRDGRDWLGGGQTVPG